ncbi:MAG: hypothetical protein R3F43_04275 [bacterium]
MADLKVPADAVVLEAPYADLRDVFSARVGRTGMLSWPFARISLFWAGNSLEFPAAVLVPAEMVKRLKVPTLVVAGGELTADDVEAARAVAAGAPGAPTLQVIPGAGKPAVLRQSEAWFEVVQAFLAGLPPVNDGPEAPASEGAASPVMLPDMAE